MVAYNMDRKHAKRELDRAKGNLAWAAQHIQVVNDGFYTAALAYAEAETDVPDSYVETMNALSEVVNSLILVGEAIQKVNDTI